VTRLANIYTKLCQAGCILFRDFYAKFICETSAEIHTIISFGLAQNCIQGENNGTFDVTRQISQICEFMDKCLYEWQKDIEEKRKEFYHLNYYTTEQLVILRQEIAKVLKGEMEGVDIRIYQMLSFVKPYCSQDVSPLGTVRG
jgi:hypothetical protein